MELIVLQAACRFLAGHPAVEAPFLWSTGRAVNATSFRGRLPDGVWSQTPSGQDAHGSATHMPQNSSFRKPFKD